jgi:hypothetical protein
MNDVENDDDYGYETDMFRDAVAAAASSQVVPDDERWSMLGGGSSNGMFHRSTATNQQLHHHVHFPGASSRSRGFRSSPPSSFCSLPSTRAGSPLSTVAFPPLSSTPPGLQSNANGRCYGCEFSPISGQHLAYGAGNALPQLMPTGRRQFNSGSGDSLHRLVDGGRCPSTALPPASIAVGRLRVSRDPTQPSSGSLRSLRSMSNEGSADDEESDEFPAVVCFSSRHSAIGGAGGLLSASLMSSPSSSLSPNGGHRPRASTCPETKAFRRRALARAMNRPPTPTPLPVDNGEVRARGGDNNDDDVGGFPRDDAEERVSGTRRPTAATVVAKSPSSEDIVDCCDLGRRLLIGETATHCDEPHQPRRASHVNGGTGGMIRLPPLHSDGGIGLTSGGLSTGSGAGRTVDRSCANVGHAFVGGPTSDLLPVITETI